jgi:DNA-binding transcriptional MerR regulator
MLDQGDNATLPPIPSKRYFTIGEVSELCLVKPHVLRYWEQEFSQLNPVKRRGNRRYYQRHEVQLYIEGFTISGAKKQIEMEAGGQATPTTQVKRKVVHELIHEIDEVVALLSE